MWNEEDLVGQDQDKVEDADTKTKPVKPETRMRVIQSPFQPINYISSLVLFCLLCSVNLLLANPFSILRRQYSI